MMSRNRGMEDKTAALLLLSFLSLTFGKQSQVLFHSHTFGKQIDRSHFNASNHFHEGQVYSQEGLKEQDLIDRLPRQPPVQFKQYGGYVTVNRTAGRALYYYFVEAHHSNNSLPLLLWLNGGPGCSSLGYGAMLELGPFRVHSDGKTLYQNDYSWNQAANVLFLESPAGVGFSYTNTSDYITGDRETAFDNYVFLVNWLERFPEYKSRDLYVAGESYAGHYVPQLGQTILYHNRSPNNTIINLRGILIGNGWINYETDLRGMFEYYGSHALVSDEITDRVLKYCNFSPNATTQPDECKQAEFVANNMSALVYNDNIYVPFCFNYSLTQTPKKTSVLTVDECSDNYVTAYLNRGEVQKALHANVTNIPYAWLLCSNDVPYSWEHSPRTTLPLLKELMANRLRVWMYSGDVDANIPVTSTKNSIKELKLPIKTSWHPWYQGEEVGGFIQVYEGDLTFATVRGAGHEVPMYQPARALTLVKQFLAGKP